MLSLLFNKHTTECGLIYTELSKFIDMYNVHSYTIAGKTVIVIIQMHEKPVMYANTNTCIILHQIYIKWLPQNV